jgi:hypothetical protein
MATQLPGQGVGFWLDWADVEPRDDPAWLWAGSALVGRFRREAAIIAASEWDKSRRRGLDRFGRPLAPISEYTYNNRRSAMGDADPDAPPLTPAYDLSRTRSFLRKRNTDRGVYFWWIRDPRVRRSWGVILGYHAAGQVRGAPIRDVIGFSDAEKAAIRAHMRRWWDARRRRAAYDAGLLGLPEPDQAGPIVVRTPVGAKVIPRAQRANLPPLVGTGRLQRIERRAVSGIDTMAGESRGAGSVYYDLRPAPTAPLPVKPPQTPRPRPVKPRPTGRGGMAAAAVLGLLGWLQRNSERESG